MNIPTQLRAACLAGVLAAATLLALPATGRAQTASQLYTEAVQTYEAGDTAAAKQKLRLSLEIDKNFRPSATLLAKIATDEKQAGAQPLGVSPQALSKVIVPVDFKDTTLQTAIEVLRQRISEKSGGKLDVNFVLKLPPDLMNKKVTIHLDRVPASEVMRYMGLYAGVDFRVQQYAVLVVPAGPSAPVAASPGVPAAPTP